MITVRHPSEFANKAQEKLIESLPEDARRVQELSFSFGNAAYRYHQEALAFKPTIKDWEDYLDGLPDKVRAVLKGEGFEQHRASFPFMRFINERHDIGFDLYVSCLWGDEFEEYKKLVNYQYK